MKKGFTLAEVMIVIVILGILAAITIHNFSRISLNNKISKAKAGVRTLQVAVENYYLFNKSVYPVTLSDLTVSVPAVLRTLPTDPFSDASVAYGYNRSSNGKNYAIYSVGPDKNGSASVSDAGVLTEANGASCIYVSNIQEDSQP